MRVLVDTSVWSLALRRARNIRHPARTALATLIDKGDALILGLVRQELLSGMPDARSFEVLRTHLRAFPDVVVQADDHEHAALFYNRCRSRGIQGSAVDFLVCAVAARRDLPILTVDRDFPRYSMVLPIRLYPLPA